MSDEPLIIGDFADYFQPTEVGVKPGKYGVWIRDRMEIVAVCQLCLQPSVRSVCDGCESTGGLFSDWRSDCGEGT